MSSSEQASAPSQQQLIGSLIQVITKAQVRYEGVLTEIEADQSQKAMTLSNVKSFGTEGRRNGVNEVQAQENEIQIVKFKVDQIIDFKILKKPEEMTPYGDPAIIAITEKQQQ